MVGLFGVAEVLLQIYSHSPHATRTPSALGRMLPTRAEIRSMLPAGLVGSAIGVWIGVVPAAGGDVGSVLAWDQSRRISKQPERFGRGSLEGLVASVTGANAGIGGSLITTFTLGVPGDSASAVLIGALLIHGLQPAHSSTAIIRPS
jgi:putative tricarboxylic transport membrane protein